MKVVLSIIGVAAIIIGILAALFFRSFDTQYSPGYSEAAFKSIKLGDTDQQVFGLLGRPFSSDDTEPFVEWIYSGNTQKRFSETGVGSGTYTTVKFDSSNRVVSIFGQQQNSANSFTIGDGLNYLRLTREQIDKLKGSDEDLIRRKFGSAAAVYKFKASKVLRYSRSPSSSNYHLRSLGVDKDGKVVHTWREIYWD